ncbi:response regulator [Acetobacteraceae bacterium KSS8]|uniref:histidine kinase n=2 Tax=Endosaccharibacter trunci TaxID=2812733 RepID=A0ABT1W6I9_9PROT|nr:response regulator [Acetobacteraceae bacterium KSS8]
MLWDANGEPQDFRYLEINDAWGRLTGLSVESALGRPNAEVLADLEPEWLDDFAAVALSGEPRTTTRPVRALGRVYEARIFRPEPGQFAVLFQDVSQRLREEARRDFLLRLSDILRDENHPDELAHRAAALLGASLGVSRAGYGTIDPLAETILIAPDWRSPGTSSIAGVLRFRDYGSYIDDLKQGTTVVIDDTRLDPRTAANSADLEAINARSFINMPVTEEGGFVALLFLTNNLPRAWTADEISLMREVAERTRVAVARRRAERDLRRLTASLESEVEARTQALLAAEEQLRQSQKMEAVGQLTGGIAHDFNNLLTGISGSLELLTVRLEQGRLSELGRYVASAQAAAQRAAALTHRLLAFSRRQTLDPKPTAVNELVVGMEEMIRRTVGPAIEIAVRCSAELWPAIVDPNQLENALLNLCLNARDAMPDGGCVTIETGNLALDDAAARERDLPPGDYVSLCVADTGTGMTPDVIARAFDPFFTTKPLGQGTGLGLSMIYGFVRQSGGQVRISSELGHGTSMRLFLPRHHGRLEGDGDSRAAAAPPRAEQGETVLVVDDESGVRILITEVLEELGYVAIEAADGAAGLKVLQSDARVDLLVTDVGLPGGMNGRQVADAARLLRPELKILFVTGYAENAVARSGYLEPGMHVLTKPFTIDVLADRIRTLIEPS